MSLFGRKSGDCIVENPKLLFQVPCHLHLFPVSLLLSLWAPCLPRFIKKTLSKAFVTEPAR